MYVEILVKNKLLPIQKTYRFFLTPFKPLIIIAFGLKLAMPHHNIWFG